MAAVATVASVMMEVIPGMKGFFTKVDSQVQTGMPSSGEKAGKTLGNSISNAASGALKVGALAVAATGAATAAFAGAAITKGLSRALNIQDAKAKLAGLGHDTESIATIMNSALDSVRGTAFGLDTAATVAASAVASGIKPGEELTKYLKLTGDAATIAGSSLGEMGAIINKTTASGKVYTDSLNQLSDRGIPIFQWLQKEYNTSAEGLTEMVKKGEVDAETFRKVIAENIGGAALESGSTARGAWANVGAAMGRLGAMFVTSAVASAPTLFTAMSNGLDRLGEALKPIATEYGDAFGQWLIDVAAWIDDIDFEYIVGWFGELKDTVVSFFTQLATGELQNYTGEFEKFGAVMEFLNPIIQNVRAAFIAIWHEVDNFISRLNSGEVSSFQDVMTAFTGTLPAIVPLLKSVAEASSQLGTTLGEVLVAAIPVLILGLEQLTVALDWLGEHSELIVPLILGIVAATYLLRLATFLATAAQITSLPVKWAGVFANRQLAASNMALAAQLAILNGTTVANTAATSGNIFTQIASRVAMVGSAIATGAVAAATGVATAAQWAWNAAMAANPITWVILVIIAIIAVIVLLATKTQFFQTIWKGLTIAWKASISFLGNLFAGFGKMIVNIFNMIVSVQVRIFKTVANFVIGLINLIISGINTMLKLINKIKVPIPKWLQKTLGTDKIGFNIPMIGTLPKMATGGDVMGPTALIAGEKDPETITNRGKTNAMIDNASRLAERALSANNEGPIVITNNIYQQEGEDPVVLARKVTRQQKISLRRNAR